MHEEAKAEIDALRIGMVPGKSIEEIEKNWDHYYWLRSYFDRYFTDDKPARKTVERLNRGLGQFTRDVREKMPSPYTGFVVELTTLRGYLESGFGDDGWPIG